MNGEKEKEKMEYILFNYLNIRIFNNTFIFSSKFLLGLHIKFSLLLFFYLSPYLLYFYGFMSFQFLIFLAHNYQMLMARKNENLEW